MTLTYTVENAKAIISKDGVEIDTVGPWETDAEAQAWAVVVCEKYNSAEYAAVDYPNELPEEEPLLGGN
jgi:hypothetical protein